MRLYFVLKFHTLKSESVPLPHNLVPITLDCGNEQESVIESGLDIALLQTYQPQFLDAYDPVCAHSCSFLGSQPGGKYSFRNSLAMYSITFEQLIPEALARSCIAVITAGCNPSAIFAPISFARLWYASLCS
jgi:hypothetical protein